MSTLKYNSFSSSLNCVGQTQTLLFGFIPLKRGAGVPPTPAPSQKLVELYRVNHTQDKVEQTL